MIELKISVEDLPNYFKSNVIPDGYEITHLRTNKGVFSGLSITFNKKVDKDLRKFKGVSKNEL